MVNVAKTRILHQTPLTLVRLRVPEDWNGSIVVSFDSAAQPRVPSEDGFGEKYLLSQRYAVCAFRCSQNDWYKWVDEKVISVTSACFRELGAAQIIGYGSSMGGYGAIKFSKALGLNRVVVFSPQSRLDHPMDHRWEQVLQKHGSIPEIDSDATDPEIRYEIYFDPRHRMDKLQCDELRSAISDDRAFIAIPYCGHPAARPLSEAGLLKQTIERAVTLREWRENRQNSAAYFGILSNHAFSRSKRQLAATLAQKAVQLRPDDPKYHYRLARALHRLGRKHNGQALAAAEQAVSLAPKNATFVFCLAETVAVRDPKRAWALAEASLDMKPQTQQSRKKTADFIERCKDRGFGS